MASPNTDRVQADQADLIARAVRKDETAIRAIIRQHNRRLFRVARSVLRDDSEAEDVLQETYLKAFAALGSFRADASLSTWLTRIVVNECLQRMRRRAPILADDTHLQRLERHDNVIPFPLSSGSPIDPERAVAQKQIAKLLERAIDALPDEFRTVLVARVLEDMSIEETADLLGIKPETVKTRLFRARRLLREELAEHVDPLLGDVFPFDGARCDRLTEAVIARLKNMP
jgi:RNA polymerase sigma-70 factor (ECF subfamily)